MPHAKAQIQSIAPTVRQLRRRCRNPPPVVPTIRTDSLAIPNLAAQRRSRRAGAESSITESSKKNAVAEEGSTGLSIRSLTRTPLRETAHLTDIIPMLISEQRPKPLGWTARWPCLYAMLMKRRPYVFVGSSAEGLDIAKAIQANLDLTCEAHIWSQGLFRLSEGTLETLVSSLERFDVAILALTGDDLTMSRGSEQRSPRDNILFETGLFVGGLDRQRVFLVADRSATLKMPSDLAGCTLATFVPPTSGTMQSALGAACTLIETQIRKLGLRKGKDIDAWWWTGCLCDGGSEDPDYFLTVVNRSQMELPWLNVHIFPSNAFTLEPTTEIADRLMAGQFAIYRFRMLSSDGTLTTWAERFSLAQREELSVRIFRRNSIDDAVLIDHDLGAQLYDRIKRVELGASPLDPRG